MANELKQYIEEALKQGLDKPAIQKTLTTAGWSGDLVRKTLDQYTGLDAKGLLIPAPKTRFHHVIRDIFVYLLTITTLCLAAYALGDLAFRIIDHFLPDAADFASNHRFGRDMNWFIAQLVVSFPLYLFLAQWTAKDVAQNPGKRDALVRKLMIYFILIVTANVGLGDFIVVLYNFLNGDLSWRFTAKALVVLAIAAMPFVYYLQAVKSDDKLMEDVEAPASKQGFWATPTGWVSALATAMIVLALGTGITLTKGPDYQRLVKLDNERIERLQQVTYAIDRYYSAKEKTLPSDLQTLVEYEKGNLHGNLLPKMITDPDTEHPFEYAVLGKTDYQLCTTFATDTLDGEDDQDSYKFSSRGWGINRHHPKGHHCYTIHKS